MESNEEDETKIVDKNMEIKTENANISESYSITSKVEDDKNKDLQTSQDTICDPDKDMSQLNTDVDKNYDSLVQNDSSKDNLNVENELDNLIISSNPEENIINENEQILNSANDNTNHIKTDDFSNRDIHIENNSKIIEEKVELEFSLDNDINPVKTDFSDGGLQTEKNSEIIEDKIARENLELDFALNDDTNLVKTEFSDGDLQTEKESEIIEESNSQENVKLEFASNDNNTDPVKTEMFEESIAKEKVELEFVKNDDIDAVKIYDFSNDSSDVVVQNEIESLLIESETIEDKKSGDSTHENINNLYKETFQFSEKEVINKPDVNIEKENEQLSDIEVNNTNMNSFYENLCNNSKNVIETGDDKLEINNNSDIVINQSENYNIKTSTPGSVKYNLEEVVSSEIVHSYDKLESGSEEEEMRTFDRDDTISYTSEMSFVVSLSGAVRNVIRGQNTYRLSSNGISNLFTYRLQPKMLSKSLIFLSHDFGEHFAYMDELGQRLRSENHIVFGHDHLGHGRSEGLPRGLIGNFQTLVDDVLNHCRDLKNDYFGLKLFFIGCGVGALIGLKAAIDDPKLFNGVVFLSPFLNRTTEMENKALVTISKALSFVSPESKFFPRSDYSQLTRVQSVVEFYKEDLLNYHGSIHPKTSLEVLSAIEFAEDNMENLTLSWLCMHGKEDKKASIKGSRLLRDLSSSNDKTFIEYDGARHMLLKEIYAVKYEIFRNISTWIQTRVYTT